MQTEQKIERLLSFINSEDHKFHARLDDQGEMVFAPEFRIQVSQSNLIGNSHGVWIEVENSFEAQFILALIFSNRDKDQIAGYLADKLKSQRIRPTDSFVLTLASSKDIERFKRSNFRSSDFRIH